MPRSIVSGQNWADYEFVVGRYRQSRRGPAAQDVPAAARRSMTPSCSNYDAQIASARANLKTCQDEEAVLVQRLETMKSIETMRATLMDKEVGSQAEFSAVARCAPRSRKQSVPCPRKSGGLRASASKRRARIEQVFAEDFRKTAYQDLVGDAREAQQRGGGSQESRAPPATDSADGSGGRHRSRGRQPHGRFGRSRSRDVICAGSRVTCRCRPRSMLRAGTSARSWSVSRCGLSSRHFRSRNTERRQVLSASSARTRLRPIRKRESAHSNACAILSSAG